MENKMNFKNVYREHLRKELSRPDIRQEKEAFLRENFSEPALPVGAPGFWVPSLAMAALFAFFLQLVPAVNFEPNPSNQKMFTLPATQPAFKSMIVKKTRAQRREEKKGIHIKRLVAKGGPIRVFSGTSEGRSVAVIWVTKASPQAA